MPLSDMIPTMSDADLKTLRANATRLQAHGVTTQQSAASEILPVIDAEIADRAARNPKPAKAAPKPRKKKVVEPVDPVDPTD